MELDKHTLNRMQEVYEMPEADRKQIFMVIDAMTRDFNAKRQYAV